MFNRWEEDWSVLADPRVPREPFDSLKYISLSVYDPKTYLSFGANLRERFEGQDAANFGIGTNRNQNYVISRSEAHADLRIADDTNPGLQPATSIELPAIPPSLRSMGSVNVQGRLAPSPFCGIVPKQEQF
jgi:hypothetical protein